MPLPLKNEFGERLVTLHTGASGLRGTMAVKITLDDKDPDLLTMRASDGTLDRYDEIITPAGWQMKDYLRCPVIQNSHQYGNIIHTIGRAERTWIDGDALMQVWRFASGINPIAKIARDMYRGGFLHASSVGFVPIRWENGTQGANFTRKYLEQELLEVSAVGIPANPNALALGIKSGAVEMGDIKAAYEILKTFCNDQAAANSDTSALGAGRIEAQSLQLYRTLGEIFKRA